MVDERIPMKVSSGSGSFMGNDERTSASVSEGFSTIEAQNDLNEILALSEASDVEDQALKYQGVVAYVKERFKRAKDGRYTDEHRWLRAYENYRGLNEAPQTFLQSEKSKLFIKITKTKVI